MIGILDGSRISCGMTPETKKVVIPAKEGIQYKLKK